MAHKKFFTQINHLTNEEINNLIHIEKIQDDYLIIPRENESPSYINLHTEDALISKILSSFTIETVNQGTVNNEAKAKIRLLNKLGQLTRLDLSGKNKRHLNSDGQIINGPHLHIGDSHDVIAIPELIGKDINEMVNYFLDYCNVKDKQVQGILL